MLLSNSFSTDVPYIIGDEIYLCYIPKKFPSRRFHTPSSCVEPLLYFSWHWRRSSRLLEGLCSVAAAVAGNASAIHCGVSREYFLTSGNCCHPAAPCSVLAVPLEGGRCFGNGAERWRCSLLSLRSDAWKMPSAGTTVTPATAAGSRGSTSVPRCSISSSRNPS